MLNFIYKYNLSFMENFYKKLGEIRPNQLITTYGPGSIMDAVNDSLTVLDIEYWDTNNIG